LLRDLNVGLLIELVRRAGSISRRISRDKSFGARDRVTMVDKFSSEEFSLKCQRRIEWRAPPVLLSVIRRPDSSLESNFGAMECHGHATWLPDCGYLGIHVPCGRFGGCHSRIEIEVRRAIRTARFAAGQSVGSASDFRHHRHESRQVQLFSLAPMSNVELAEPLRRHLGMPVWVENDVNTLASPKNGLVTP